MAVKVITPAPLSRVHEDLLRLARAFEAHASFTTDNDVWLDHRQAAAQLRFTAARVASGSYDEPTARAWVDAARLKLQQFTEGLS